MHQGPRTEAVARLLEREALTASPKASVNLCRQNGVGDVWQISHCLSSHFGGRLRRGLVLGETGEKTRQARRSFTSQTKWAFLLSEAGAWVRGLGLQREVHRDTAVIPLLTMSCCTDVPKLKSKKKEVGSKALTLTWATGKVEDAGHIQAV